ncbi:MAG: DUF188 domain-containing protein [Nitratireductor sp.]
MSNQGMRPSRNPLVRHVVVSDKFDAADDWIVDNANANDIAVTADVPLAVRLVDKGDRAWPTGRRFTPQSVGMASALRDLNQELREAGVISGYNKPFSARDRSAFLQAMELAVRQARAAKA